MTLLKNLWKTYGHYLLIPVIIILNFVLNWLTQNIKPRFQMAARLDHVVPFLKGFVIPYFICIVFIVIVPLFLAIKSRKAFTQYSTLVITGQVICVLVYLIYPNSQNLRPDVMSNDIFSRMILAIYRRNFIANAAPSIHVLYSLAAHFGLMRYEPFSKHKILPFLLCVFTLIFIISTMFIKQDSVLDVLSGILLSFALYILIYKEKPDGKKYGPLGNFRKQNNIG